MPGHKGRLNASFVARLAQADLTELAGFDDLARPGGILAGLEARAAKLWHSGGAVISLNGASGGLIASLFAVAHLGKKVLVPRNAHRSIVNGLILSGLMPIWYEPEWHETWGIWGAAPAAAISDFLKSEGELAAVVVVSPTYAGARSDIAALAELCSSCQVALIVDEAHGAHNLWPGAEYEAAETQSDSPYSAGTLANSTRILPESDTTLPDSSKTLPALQQGADIVVHSLHKTLGGLTQTGIVHVSKRSPVTAEAIRAALHLVHTSSPSYMLMLSIEQAVAELESSAGKQKLANLYRQSYRLVERIKKINNMRIYESTACGVDPLHILVASQNYPPEILQEFLAKRGIIAEAILGAGLLFMLGIGTEPADLELLAAALREFADSGSVDAGKRVSAPSTSLPPSMPEQVVPLREAALLSAENVACDQAGERIAAEMLSPCPPGIPLCIPGQRLTAPSLAQIKTQTNIKSIRVLQHR